MKFLIVDDSKAMQTIVHKALVTSGYSDHDYDYAFNGRQALDKIHTSKPDIILCDWNMPEMSGLELLHKIREENLDVKIGLVTTERYEARIKEAMDAGALFVVSKPFTAEVLAAAVEEVLSFNNAEPPGNELPPIILPEPKIIKKTLTSFAKRTVSMDELDDFSVSPLQFPFVVCLYQAPKATRNVIAVAVLDVYAAAYLGASAHNIAVKEISASIQGQILPKDCFDTAKIFLELLATHMTNEDDSIDVSSKGVHMVSTHMSRFQSLVQKKKQGSHSYKITVEGYGSGKLFLLAQ